MVVIGFEQGDPGPCSVDCAVLCGIDAADGPVQELVFFQSDLLS